MLNNATNRKKSYKLFGLYYKPVYLCIVKYYETYLNTLIITT